MPKFELPYKNLLWVKNNQPVEGTSQTDDQVLSNIDKIGRVVIDETTNREVLVDSPTYPTNEDGAINGLVKQLFKNQLYIADWIKNIYPVGSIFISTSNENPSVKFGGTWENLGARFLVGAGTLVYPSSETSETQSLLSNTWSSSAQKTGTTNSDITKSQTDSKFLGIFHGTDDWNYFSYKNIVLSVHVPTFTETLTSGKIVQIKGTLVDESSGSHTVGHTYKVLLSNTDSYGTTGLDLGDYYVGVGDTVEISKEVTLTNTYTHFKIVCLDTSVVLDRGDYLRVGMSSPSITVINRTVGSSKTLSVGDAGGEYLHKLTLSESPAHTHKIATKNNYPSDATSHWLITDGNEEFPIAGRAGNTYTLIADDSSKTPTIGTSEEVGGDEPHNNLPPYYVVNMWRRLS